MKTSGFLFIIAAVVGSLAFWRYLNSGNGTALKYKWQEIVAGVDQTDGGAAGKFVAQPDTTGYYANTSQALDYTPLETFDPPAREAAAQ